MGLDENRDIKKEEIEGLCIYGMISIKTKIISKRETINRFILTIPFSDVLYAFEEHPTFGKLIAK